MGSPIVEERGLERNKSKDNDQDQDANLEPDHHGLRFAHKRRWSPIQEHQRRDRYQRHDNSGGMGNKNPEVAAKRHQHICRGADTHDVEGPHGDEAPDRPKGSAKRCIAGLPRFGSGGNRGEAQR